MNLPSFVHLIYFWMNIFHILDFCICSFTMMDTSMWNSVDFLKNESFFVETMASWVQNRSVNVKIGGLNVKGKDTSKEYWFEFDPIVSPYISKERIILPFIVDITEREDGNVLFYEHSYSGCSSVIAPLNKYGSSDKDNYINSSIQLCNSIINDRHLFQSFDIYSWCSFFSWWKPWVHDSDLLNVYKSTWEVNSNVCFQCQSRQNVLKNTSFSSVSLSRVVDWFQKIDVLEIEAQGIDVALVLSLNNSQLSKVHIIQIECQSSSQQGTYNFHYLYDKNSPHGFAYTENNCSLAQRFLESNHFVCRHQVKNCGCSEFNLFCHQIHHDD